MTNAELAAMLGATEDRKDKKRKTNIGPAARISRRHRPPACADADNDRPLTRSPAFPQVDGETTESS